MKRRLGGVIVFLLKLPFRMAAIPVMIVLTILQFLVSLLIGLSSIVTNLIGTVGIVTAACIWMFRLGTNNDAYGMLAVGLLFLLLPHVASWFVTKITDTCAALLAFVVP